MKLRYFIIRRLISSFITVLFVIFISFVLLYAGLQREPRQIAAIFGGNYSLPVLFFTYLKDIFTGNWGYLPASFPFFESFSLAYVMTLLLPDTLQLLLVSLTIALVISIPIGTRIGIHPNSVGDMLGRIYTFGFYGMPIIFTSFFFQMLLARGGILGLGLPDTGPFNVGLTQPTFLKYGVTFPTHVPILDGVINGNFSFAWSSFEHLIMPSLVLSLWTSAALTRFLRTEIMEHRNDYHIIAARSRGLSDRTVMKRYIRRNSYIPFVTLLGPLSAMIIGWVVVTEDIFGYPGIGNFIIASALNFYMVGLATGLMILGIILVSMNFLADIIYAFLDPRIRF